MLIEKVESYDQSHTMPKKRTNEEFVDDGGLTEENKEETLEGGVEKETPDDDSSFEDDKNY